MPVRKAITEKDGVYFITFTCTNRLPLFKICDAYNTVYNWFNRLKEQGHYIIGYAIMPSHIHAFSCTFFLIKKYQKIKKQSNCSGYHLIFYWPSRISLCRFQHDCFIGPRYAGQALIGL